ncbi:hypothetical protein GCM10007897_34040 [Sphingobium jiangsuense]|nr:hypothetical protein GCM10007897_34040 [Sphingobium jiangsuense]
MAMDKKRNPTERPMPRLDMWDTPVRADKTDAVCSHCHNPFVSYQGYVSGEFNLCPVCFDRD